MDRKYGRIAGASALALLLAVFMPAAVPAGAAPAASAPSVSKAAAKCPVTNWNTKRDTSGSTSLTRGQLFDVRQGRHDCFDRVVFDISGTKANFRVEYVSVVGHEGSGNPVPVAGAADLQVTLYAPAPELFAGFGWKGNYPSLKEIRFAGSFEGMTTFAVGVAKKRPFAVESWRQGDVTHVILDIAH